MKQLNALQKKSQGQIIALGIVLTALVGLLDYLTGYELSFSIVYLIPIALVTWLVKDQRVNIVAAILAAVIWLLVDHFSGRPYSSNLIPFWNASVRLGFFLIVVFSLSSLRAANEHREELAQFIVHDLRSPLANNLSALAYLMEISEETMDEGQLELIKLSLASANRMLTLVNSLLDLAKLESGHLELNQQPTDVSDMFDAALAQVKAMAVRNEVNVVSEVDAGTETVLADSDLVVRVLVNLISNALKYSPNGSQVRIRASLYTSHQVAIEVHDNGIGIPKEWAKRVFEKFSQVEARRRGMAVGSGLGLTFCRLAIEAHGGRIWVESEQGQGTTMKFTLAQVSQ